MEQQRLIERVTKVAEADELIDSVMMYGSFARSEGDRFSDVEFYVFVDDAALPTFEVQGFLTSVAPVAAHYLNEYGVRAVIFESLVRGEFHFEPASTVTATISSWTDAWYDDPARPVLVDRSGRLTAAVAALPGQSPDRDNPETARRELLGVTNWLLMVANLVERGEYARALEFFAIVHVHLLRLARIVAGTTDNWLSPSRRLETDLAETDYQRFVETVATLDPTGLRRAVKATWQWTRQLAEELQDRYDLDVSSTMLVDLDGRFAFDDVAPDLDRY